MKKLFGLAAGLVGLLVLLNLIRVVLVAPVIALLVLFFPISLLFTSVIDHTLIAEAHVFVMGWCFYLTYASFEDRKEG